MIQEWGPRAAEQIGVVLGRARTMLNKMSAADREKTNAWVDSLSPTQFRAVAKSSGALEGGRRMPRMPHKPRKPRDPERGRSRQEAA